MARCFFFLLFLIVSAKADTPANCSFEDVVGKWTFYESERSGDSRIDCSLGAAVVEKVEVKLVYPNEAIDQWNNKGTWTMIYNQGFEVTVAGRSYFAFSDFSQEGQVTNTKSPFSRILGCDQFLQSDQTRARLEPRCHRQELGLLLWPEGDV